MPNLVWSPSNVPFSCTRINQEVVVVISTVPLYGQGQFPINQAKRMDDCSGKHICGLFPHPLMFHTQGPHGCPCHDNLNKG
jgi:hypothetical protein